MSAERLSVVVIGAGPAGLMAAEVLSAAGHDVHVFDAMASVGRKFLLAGRGGLNLTHSEPMPVFKTRYGERAGHLAPMLDVLGNAQVQQWAHSLGVPTFVGSSGRVFPSDMKAAPLLRAWLHRLRHPAQGRPVRFHLRHRWLGWSAGGDVLFESEGQSVAFRAGTTILALGGGSWSRLGSDGAWVSLLRNQGVEVAPLLASNCGFDLEPGWSPFFVERHAGQPFKSVALRVMDGSELLFQRQGEFVATETGVEGSLVYAASSVLRDLVLRQGHATAWLDLLPHWPLDKVVRELSVPRGARSFSTHLKSRLGLSGIKAAVLYESWSPSAGHDPVEWAHRIKAVPLRLARTRPLDEAISSAGGVAWEALDAACMLRALPGVYCAGEMLDWEAPTGGYLLTACLALGHWVGRAVDEQLRRGL